MAREWGLTGAGVQRRVVTFSVVGGEAACDFEVDGRQSADADAPGQQQRRRQCYQKMGVRGHELERAVSVP